MADRRSKDAWRTYLDDPTPLNLLQVERQRVRTYQAPLPLNEPGRNLQTGWEIFHGVKRLVAPIYPTWGKDSEVSNALGAWLVENHDQRFEDLLPTWFDQLQIVQTTAGRARDGQIAVGVRVVYPVVCSPFFATAIREELESMEAEEGDVDDNHATEVANQAIWTIESYYERNPEADRSAAKERLIGISGTWRTLFQRPDEELNTPEAGPNFLPALKAAVGGDCWSSDPLLSWSVQTGAAWEGMGKDARQINAPSSNPPKRDTNMVSARSELPRAHFMRVYARNSDDEIRRLERAAKNLSDTPDIEASARLNMALTRAGRTPRAYEATERSGGWHQGGFTTWIYAFPGISATFIRFSQPGLNGPSVAELMAERWGPNGRKYNGGEIPLADFTPAGGEAGQIYSDHSQYSVGFGPQALEDGKLEEALAMLARIAQEAPPAADDPPA